MASALLYWPEAIEDPAIRRIMQRIEPDEERRDEEAEWGPLDPGDAAEPAGSPHEGEGSSEESAEEEVPA